MEKNTEQSKVAMTWVGSRRLVTPEFEAEIDEALREYRGPGIYKHTGERIAPLQKTYEHRGPIQLHWVRTVEDYEKIMRPDE